MWEPLKIKKVPIAKTYLDSLHSGKIPAIIIPKFFGKKYCQNIVNRINKYNFEISHDHDSNHIGPFLMSFTTKKDLYFSKAKSAQDTFKKIFSGVDSPYEKLFQTLRLAFPTDSLSLANESGFNFAPFIIRIHSEGKSIPIHKDNVKYEGKEYGISNIDNQLSCVLHLQNSAKGGNLIIYKKQWEKKDEKFRKIDFGYSSTVISSSEFSLISDIKQGDLVLINPNNYHQVTTIKGDQPRITLGMFLGFYKIKNRIVAWA